MSNDGKHEDSKHENFNQDEQGSDNNKPQQDKSQDKSQDKQENKTPAKPVQKNSIIDSIKGANKPPINQRGANPFGGFNGSGFKNNTHSTSNQRSPRSRKSK